MNGSIATAERSWWRAREGEGRGGRSSSSSVSPPAYPHLDQRLAGRLDLAAADRLARRHGRQRRTPIAVVVKVRDRLVDRLDLAGAELFAARRAQLVQDVGRGVLDIEQAQTLPSAAAVGAGRDRAVAQPEHPPLAQYLV